MLAVVFVASLATLAAAALVAQRGYRSCIVCRDRFRSVELRRIHERLMHGIGGGSV